MSISRRVFLGAGALWGIAQGADLIHPLILNAQGRLPAETGRGEGLTRPRPHELIREGLHASDIDHLSGLRKDDFSSQKGETFRAFPPDGAPVSLQLIEVADIKPRAGKKRLEAPATSPNPGQECFSLIFQGPPGTTLWQDTFKLVNTQLGQFAMLLVPVGRDSSHTYFQAVINRLTP